MGKKNYTVQWTPDITVTAGNGSISVADTKTGGTDTTTTTVYPYTDNFKTVVSDEMVDHLEGYGFNDSKMEYKFPDDFKEALKKVIKEAVLEEVVFDKEKEVKAIPIEWLKENLPKDEDYIRLKGYRDLPENDLMNVAYDEGFNNGWEAFRKAFIEDTISEWEEENENDMYIPKKSPNFTFSIFDLDSGETIAEDIPLSDKNAKEIFDNYEKIKAEKSNENLEGRK